MSAQDLYASAGLLLSLARRSWQCRSIQAASSEELGLKRKGLECGSYCIITDLCRSLKKHRLVRLALCLLKPRGPCWAQEKHEKPPQRDVGIACSLPCLEMARDASDLDSSGCRWGESSPGTAVLGACFVFGLGKGACCVAGVQGVWNSPCWFLTSGFAFKVRQPGDGSFAILSVTLQGYSSWVGRRCFTSLLRHHAVMLRGGLLLDSAHACLAFRARILCSICACDTSMWDVCP